MFENIFGFSIRCEAWDKQKLLPFYIANDYEFSKLFIGEKCCLAIKPRNELATLPALKKQIKAIQKIDNIPVVLEFDAISSYRKKSLLENNIPFITRKQIFLPFIGAMLTNENETQERFDKFVYSTQQLFLSYIYNNQKKLYVASAAQNLPFSAMTLSRAVKQLESAELFKVTKDGVNKVIEAKYTKAELFTRAKNFLQSPIRQWGYIEKKDITSNMVFAGETALAEKTMLNPPRIVTYAIFEKDFDKTKMNNEFVDPEAQVKLELWAYEPTMFSKGNTADNLSIALSFVSNKDERIEEAVDELIKKELEK